MKIKLFSNSGVSTRSVTMDGFNMTGYLRLWRHPVDPNEAASKGYVDTFPMNLNVENIQGNLAAAARIVGSFSGDLVSPDGVNTAFPPVVAAGTYTQYEVDAKGRVIVGSNPAPAGAPTLAFTEVKNRPTVASGYVSNTSNYISGAVGVTNSPLTSPLTLSRQPQDPTEVAALQYLQDQLTTLTGGAAIGSVMLKPNTIAHPTYLKANGALLDKTTYAALYAIIGHTYNTAGFGCMGQPWRQQFAFNSQTQGVGNEITGWAAYNPTGAYDTNLIDRQVIITRNRIYLLGGYYGGSVSDAIETAPINADGTIGAWVAAGNLPFQICSSQAVIVKDKIYLLGGGGPSNTSYLTIWKTTINSDGTIGAWYNSDTPLPAAVVDAQALVTTSRIYLIGGGPNNSTSSGDAHWAPIDANGNIGVWNTITLQNKDGGGFAPSDAQLIITKNKVYIAYGTSLAVADISENGVLGSFTITTGVFDISTGDGQMVVTNNRAYFYYSGVGKTAPIDVDGNVGVWVDMTSLPPAAPNFFLSQFAITNSKVYMFGENTYVAPFAGGSRDYLTLATLGVLTDHQFKLPDLSTKGDNNIYEYYIKATA